MTTPRFRKREKEVIELLLQGKSNKQIAHELGISTRTVEFHLSNIYARLDTRSRTEAVVKLTEMNMRKTAGKNTRRNLRKSTVAEEKRSSENDGNQIKRSFPMKNLLIGLAIGVALTIVVAFAFTFMNRDGGSFFENKVSTHTPVPFEPNSIEMVPTPTPILQPSTFEETPTMVPTSTSFPATPPTLIPTQKP